MRWLQPMTAGFVMLALGMGSVVRADGPSPKVGERVDRRGDEIVACGQLFHTQAPVKLWTDPGGYDAYRIDHRFGPPPAPAVRGEKEAMPEPLRRFRDRRAGLTATQLEQTRGGNWTLPMLQEHVDQFVVHFDVCGCSQTCFRVLHDERGLSVHFMLDVDGTIYQTLDLKEAAWHATKANDRSIGIEIANVGTFRPGNNKAGLAGRWYAEDPDGRTRLVVPDAKMVPTLDAGTVLRPARDRPVVGNVQNEDLAMYDLTPQQYDSLIKLTATLCRVFPKIRCDYPRGADGQLTPRKLPDDVYDRYQGIMGHYHVQANKNDPGPAFQWDRLIDGSRKLLAD